MSVKESKKEFESEIRTEFQLERMILFSDAVFAIVITLMAIEIHLPISENISNPESFQNGLLHQLPSIIAYAVSFLFIGMICCRHLQLFQVLKNYDKGIVIRNLLLHFYIELFPFAATVVTIGTKNGTAPFLIYLGVILLYLLAQLILHHFILFKRR